MPEPMIVFAETNRPIERVLHDLGNALSHKSWWPKPSKTGTSLNVGFEDGSGLDIMLEQMGAVTRILATEHEGVNQGLYAAVTNMADQHPSDGYRIPQLNA
jgi:hypothetical protein